MPFYRRRYFTRMLPHPMYVVEMPVSIVKLDMDMSKAFFQTPKAKQVVRAVVSMAHGMGLKVVAEGIETKEENLLISQEGIDYIQGYYYSRPLPLGAILEFLETSANAVQKCMTEKLPR